MPYVLPVFNLPINIWHSPNVPPALPDVVTTGNLTPGRRTLSPYQPRQGGAVLPANMHLLLPAGTDIRDAKSGNPVDLVEVPAGSGRFYEVGFVDDIGLGFLNEHRFAQLIGLGPWPVPFPSGGSIPISGGSNCPLASPALLNVSYIAPLPNLSSRWFGYATGIPPIGTSFTFTVSGLLGTQTAQAVQGDCGLFFNLMPPSTNGTYSFSSVILFPNSFLVDLVDTAADGLANVTFRLNQP